MPETECPVCGGSGWKIVERDGLSGAERCSCAGQERARLAETTAGIPPLYKNASLDNFQLPKDNPTIERSLSVVLLTVRAFIRQFPETERPGLLLVGDTGSGKTHLAVAALRGVMAKGFGGVFFDYQNLLDRIRASYDPDSGETNREAYRVALDSEVLLLDDLGSHRVKEWVEDTVTSIITYRCNHKKPLIATTNLPDPDAGGRLTEHSSALPTVTARRTLAEHIGMRARSRLFEMCRIVRMPQMEDFRVRRTR